MMENEIVFITEPEELLKLKKYQKFRFICRACGELNEKVYTHSRYERYKNLLCGKCSQIKTCREKFGTDYYVQTSEFKTKTKLTNLNTIGVEYPGQCKNCRMKGVKTYSENHGLKYDGCSESLFSLKEIQNKSSKSINEKYGKNWYTQTEEFKVKSKAKKKEKYGDENYNNRPKAEESCLNTLGVKNPMQLKEIHKTAEETTFNKHGYKCAFEVKEIREKNRAKFKFDNVSFDSGWELALWIYAKDHNEEIIREPCTFEYTHNGMIHHYTPDFLYKGKLIEIKGDHFFKDGKMICPWDSSLNDEYNEKYKCGLLNGVEFWKKEQCKMYVEYVENTYYPRYISEFRIQNM